MNYYSRFGDSAALSFVTCSNTLVDNVDHLSVLSFSLGSPVPSDLRPQLIYNSSAIHHRCSRSYSKNFDDGPE